MYFSLSVCIPSSRIASCKQHDGQLFVETTPMSSSTTILCFSNSEWLWQDLLPLISPQRDWYHVFPRYFCNSNSNHFLSAWENSRAVFDIIQTPSFYYYFYLYISEVEKTNSSETSFRFWISLQILGFLNYLPTSCRTAIVMQAANQRKKCSSPLSQSLSGQSPADQKARGLWVWDWYGSGAHQPEPQSPI